MYDEKANVERHDLALLPGSLRIGPLPVPSLDALSGHLEVCGLKISECPDVDLRCDRLPEGLFLTATGAGVRAYLLDADHVEASLDDVERLARRILPDGASFEIRGCHDLEGGRLLLAQSRHEKRDSRILSRVETSLLRSGLGIVERSCVETIASIKDATGDLA
jgi:hypothetical protein